jgi:hypothetical protein
MPITKRLLLALCVAGITGGTAALAAAPQKTKPQPAPVGACSMSDAGRAFVDFELERIAMRTAAMQGQWVSAGRVTDADRTYREAVAKAYAGCRKGDTLQLPKMMTYLITDHCDLSKTVIPQGDAVICVQK